MGIEPTCEAWKASVLPLNYARLRCASARQARHIAANPAGLLQKQHNARACAVPLRRTLFTSTTGPENREFVGTVKGYSQPIIGGYAGVFRSLLER